MSARKHVVVVDGSNLATEGRTMPSLAQLDEAVRAYLEEHPGTEAIVVADATFEHRVSAEERPKVKEAELNNEIVTPPAGVIGRGDAFILKIAAKVGAVVLSNDSFQEFHAEHPWLFEEGRLVGGKPVPGVGWVFAARNPVRGVRSRQATSAARRASAETREPEDAAAPTRRSAKPVEHAPASKRAPRIGDTRPAAKKSPAKKAAPVAASAPKKAVAKKAPAAAKKVTAKKAEAAPKKAASKKAAPVEKATTKAAAKKASKSAVTKAAAKKAPAKKAEAAPKKTPAKRAAAAKPSAADREVPETRTGMATLNTPRAFLALLAAHPLQSKISGEVRSFTSHGAMVTVTLDDGTEVVCYAPNANLATPAPTRARDVLSKGERRRFRLVGLDKDRRVAELSLL